MTTGLLYDPLFLEHDTGHGHPECPERLSRTIQHLQGLPWFDALHHYTSQPVDRKWLHEIHDEEYLKRAEESCLAGEHFLDSMDVAICEKSFTVALHAAGGMLLLGDEVMNGNIKNGMGLVRPPGHHAERSMALGFCIINNVAVLARYLQKQHGLEKIVILDWDVHHGNGTQHTFEKDPTVFYISTHQYPFYPGSGAWSETGTGRGEGVTLNIPMPPGAGDADYEEAFLETILPAIDAFAPRAILISAGFDAHTDDPLANISLSTPFYGWMTGKVMELADKHCDGRIISVLEGGYDLNALPRCVEQHLGLLSGQH